MFYGPRDIYWPFVERFYNCSSGRITLRGFERSTVLGDETFEWYRTFDGCLESRMILTPVATFVSEIE